MSLKLTNQTNKTITHPESGAIFKYRELSNLESQRLLLKYRKNGKVSDEDAVEAGFEFMEEMVTGWENIEDDEGNKIAFDKAIIKSFPIDIILFWYDKIISGSVNEINVTKDKLVKKGHLQKEMKNLG